MRLVRLLPQLHGWSRTKEQVWHWKKFLKILNISIELRYSEIKLTYNLSVNISISSALILLFRNHFQGFYVDNLPEVWILGYWYEIPLLPCYEMQHIYITQQKESHPCFCDKIHVVGGDLRLLFNTVPCNKTK